jgi:diketogulonate reductase-like aldo/keto reductase
MSMNREAAMAHAPALSEAELPSRPIPSTGEPLPLVGLGTYRGFDVQGPSAVRALCDVVDILLDAGPAMIDSSPMYGRAEEVVGQVLDTLDRRDNAFLATKVWTRGKINGQAQMEASLKKLRTDRVDLMHVHNLLDVDSHLDTLKGWKADGRTRYVGVTHYHSGAYDALEAVMRREPIDFVQLNYSLDDRAAEERLLPLARDRGVAVIVNVPFGGGGLIQRLAREPLPDFAAAIGCKTWPQILLKFVIGHPTVTCAIPGTGDPVHMGDNLAAAQGDLASARDRIAAWWRARS